MKRTPTPEKIHHNQHKLASVIAGRVQGAGLQVSGTPLPERVLFVPKHINSTDPFVFGVDALQQLPWAHFAVLGKPSLRRWTFGILPKLGVDFVKRAKDIKSAETDERKIYIHEHAAHFGQKLLEPFTVGMSFGESTRAPENVRPIKVGVVLAAGYAALQSGESFPVQAVGLAGNTWGALLHRAEPKQPRMALVYAEPVYVPADVLSSKPYSLNEEVATMYRKQITASLVEATNDARNALGLMPLSVR